jgi:hypothetical protein
MVSLRNIAVTALLFWGTADAAFYGKNSPVVSLDKNNFKEEILDSRNAAVSDSSSSTPPLVTLPRELKLITPPQ